MSALRDHVKPWNTFNVISHQIYQKRKFAPQKRESRICKTEEI